MKYKLRVRRRKNGSFQAMIQDRSGAIVWACDHEHSYGTSNRAKQDAASKCAYAQVTEMRRKESHEEATAQV